jgi:hypothetical protein
MLNQTSQTTHFVCRGLVVVTYLQRLSISQTCHCHGFLISTRIVIVLVSTQGIVWSFNVNAQPSATNNLFYLLSTRSHDASPMIVGFTNVSPPWFSYIYKDCYDLSEHIRDNMIIQCKCSTKHHGQPQNTEKNSRISPMVKCILCMDKLSLVWNLTKYHQRKAEKCFCAVLLDHAYTIMERHTSSFFGYGILSVIDS